MATIGISINDARAEPPYYKSAGQTRIHVSLHWTFFVEDSEQIFNASITIYLNGNAQETWPVSGSNSLEWTKRITVMDPVIEVKAEVEGQYVDTRLGQQHWSISNLDTRKIILQDDKNPPVVEVSPQNFTVDIPENGTNITLNIQAQDLETGVKRVFCDYGGIRYAAQQVAGNPLNWTARVGVSPEALGPGNITVTCEDWAGNLGTRTVTFTGRDVTPPHPPLVSISSPVDGYEHPKGENLIVRGIASDLQTGIASLEWRLNDKEFSSVPKPWDNWGFEIDSAILESGPHSLEIRCRDQAGNVSHPHPELIVNFQVADVYVPQDVNDLTNLPEYLRDLIAFSRNRICKSWFADPNNDPRVTDKDLENTLLQPFSRLADVRTLRAQEPVNQLRPCIEVLRRFLRTDQQGFLIAHWRFDEGDGDVLNDATGNGHAGTRKGASWRAGREGSTLSFNGTGDYVDVQGSDRLRTVTNNFTIAFWAYPIAFRKIDQESDGGTSGMQGQRYAIYPAPGGIFGSSEHACVGISVGTNGVSVYEHSDDYLPALLVHELIPQDHLKAWTHIAVVYRDKRPYLYLNGRLVYDGGIRSEKTYVHAYFESIGGGVYGWYPGYLDEVRVFEGALTDIEIAALASVRITSRQPWPKLVAETDYRLAAYETSLNRIGTSYEELRLAQKADVATKEAFAQRLGLPFSALQDTVETLFLSQNSITETNLERLFGLLDTGRDPLADPPQREPQLSSWRRSYLKARWRIEDAEVHDRDDGPVPIVDPDLIAEADLALALPGSLVYDLWKKRSSVLDEKFKELEERRKSKPTSSEGFAELITAALGDDAPKFQELQEQESGGNDIEAQRARLGFTEVALRRIFRIRDLAQAGEVTPAEWEDAYHILVQAWKQHQFQAWRHEEITPGKEILLTPSYFKLGGTWPTTPWRSEAEARFAWEERLQNRLEQIRAMEESLLADILAVEEQTLPILRDALVGSFARRLGLHPEDAADYLTARLFVDIRSKGALQSTRLLQGTETLQSFIETLRLRQLQESHPAFPWELAFLDTNPSTGQFVVRKIPSEDFAKEWRYMGVYDAWRGAMSVFFFPENLLLPSLRPNASGDFSKVVKDLRGKRRFTNEELDSALKKAGLQEEEKKYYMRMEIALRLQATGDYLRALDWFRKVYPYDQPLAQRRIGEGIFDHERNEPSALQRTPDWLKELDPHSIARMRGGNPYTRYTLMAVARCFMEYADAEFAFDTIESLARARNLYLSARTILSLPELDPPVAHEESVWMEDGLPAGALPWGENGDTWEWISSDPDPFSGQLAHRSAVAPAVHQHGFLSASVPLQIADDDLLFAYVYTDFHNPPREVMLCWHDGSDWEHRAYWGENLIQAGIDGTPSRRYMGPLPALAQWIRLEVPSAVVGLANRQISGMAFTLFGGGATWDRAGKTSFIPKNAFGYPNPVLEALRQRLEVQLTKLREGRNIAGLKRQLELPVVRSVDTTLAAIGTGGQLMIPGARSFSRPTPYRYQVLIERSKQLVNVSQQVEANFLAALEKRDKETYDLLQAKYGLQLANEGIELQRRRHDGVKKEVDAADLQKKRVKILRDTYEKWLNTGLNGMERQVLQSYEEIRDLKDRLNDAQVKGAVINAFIGIVAAGAIQTPDSIVGAIKGIVSTGEVINESYIKEQLNKTELKLSLAEKRASFERRADEWRFQKSLAEQDTLIADKQKEIAEQHVLVSSQELRISEVQALQAEATAVFLATKFTNAELYDWMSRVLREVYSYFLQQAAATAQLAQNQLAFERQDVPPAFIQADYWQLTTEDAADTRSQPLDRQGLTGSSRLLQDIYKLDQYAFETDKRKLNLSQTFSLASLLPYEFALFRENGVLPFATQMRLFDEGFPGHYLRLIKRVRVSIVALIPTARGVRATLRSGGISRVVTGDSFQEVPMSRAPELVALTSPSNASGVFELDLQSDMLLPFEGMGVDTQWMLELPKAANPFDFGTIADVLFTVDYTALHSDEYSRQVVKRLPRKVSADLSLSIRNQFPDAWYDLNNPEQLEIQKQMVISFKTTRTFFPPNVEDTTIKLDHLLLYFIRKNGSTFEIPVSYLNFTNKGGQTFAGGEATSIDGIISTRSGNGRNWESMIGMTPFGDWELSFQFDDPGKDREIRDRFKNEEIEDILFVMTYSGRTPAWPA